MFCLLRLAFLYLMLSSFSVLASEKPKRVVSINLCTDQLALMLGGKDQIKSVTFMATDPKKSIMHEAASVLPINYGSAEEVLAFKPDLVLAGTYSARYTVALLRKLKRPVTVLEPANNLDEIARNIRIVAKALGYPERGETSVEEMYSRASAMTERKTSPLPRAVIYRTGGRVAGEPSLGHSALELAGFINIAKEQKLGSWGSLPLEGLMRSHIDVLVRDLPRDGSPSYGSLILSHPALKHDNARFLSVELDGRSTICGTPHLLDAADRLRLDYREALSR